MGKNGLKMGVWLSFFFYKFSENREFFQGRFLPYKLGIETPDRMMMKILIFHPSLRQDRENGRKH